MMQTQAIQTIQQIKELEAELERLKANLKEMQATCEHIYESNTLVSTCTKCRKVESNYY